MAGKKILLVGGGIGQVHLARLIRQRGDHLVVMAYHVMDEVALLAEKVIIQDLFDLDGSLETARRVKPDAVVSDQHDLYVPTVAYLAEHLGLPGNTWKQALVYCNKNLFRDTCDRLGIPVPAHAEVRVGDILPGNLSFPVIVKPADAQSSLGISRVNGEEDYPSAVANALSFSRSGSAIVESFIEGRELVSEGLILNGRYLQLCLADRFYFSLEGRFIPSRTVFPSDISAQVAGQMCAYESRLAAEVGVSFAIVHTEWLYNERSGRLFCVESALRGGGVSISSHLVPSCCGIDVNEWLLDCAVGNPPSLETLPLRKAPHASAYICFCLPEGIVERVRGIEEVRNMAGVMDVSIEGLSPGTRVMLPQHKGQRFGPILVQADSRQELERLVSGIRETLKVEVRGQDGILRGAIWN